MIYEATYRDGQGNKLDYTRQIYASNEQRAIDELIHHKYFLLTITNLSTKQIVLDKETK